MKTYTQKYYEDVAVGESIPSLTKHPSRRQLVKWAGAAREFWEMHYDDKFATDNGFPSVIVHGMLNNSFLCEMVQDWGGPNSMIRVFKSQHRSFVLVDKDVVCTGVITGKRIENGQHLVDIDIKLNCEGKDCVLGQITVELPSKAA